MFFYIWPIALVVLANTAYQICTKSIPDSMNPFASLTVTYIIGAVASIILYYIFDKNANLFQEYKKLNWAPIVLGLVIVALEAGWIFAHKAGWQISTAQIVQSAVLGTILFFSALFTIKNRLHGIKSSVS